MRFMLMKTRSGNIKLNPLCVTVKNPSDIVRDESTQTLSRRFVEIYYFRKDSFTILKSSPVMRRCGKRRANKMFKHIFLDMDGVIVDFDAGVRERYHAPWWYPTEWKIPYRQFGTDFKTFWNDLDFPGFWEKLPWTEDGKQIVSLVEPYKPTILTCSALSCAAAGKLEWLRREYPDTLKDKRVLISAGHVTKAAVAGPGKVLIDDKNENIDEWEATGGMGILYPRPWNRLADHPYPLEYLMGMLMYHMGGK
jgi:hypothetical protein